MRFQISVLLCALPLLLLLGVSTLPAQNRPFTFIAIGDGGEKGEVLTGNARYMLEAAEQGARNGRPVNALLFLGDNFYPTGLNTPTDEARQELIEEILGPHRPLMRMLGRENVYSIPGNHEYYCATLNRIPYGSCNMGNLHAAALPEWTYMMHYPVLVRRPIAERSADSVDLIFFDSGLLLAQETDRWRPVLDSLERLLRRSASARGVTWRIFATHHSPYSVGEHGGYRVWLPGEERVGYVGNCFEDQQDPLKYVEQLLSHQDNCTPRYQAYSDSLLAIMGRSGAKIQLLMAGHDHSLQLLYLPGTDCASCPKTFMVNGAGSKRARVKFPEPPNVFTHPVIADKGKSLGGFTYCAFEGNSLTLKFINSADGQPIDMGGGVTTFVIDQAGRTTGR